MKRHSLRRSVDDGLSRKPSITEGVLRTQSGRLHFAQIGLKRQCAKSTFNYPPDFSSTLSTCDTKISVRYRVMSYTCSSNQDHLPTGSKKHKLFTRELAIPIAIAASSMPFTEALTKLSHNANHETRNPEQRSGHLFKVRGSIYGALATIPEMLKGAIGPLLAGGNEHPRWAAISGAAAVVGYNLSPLIQDRDDYGHLLAAGALLATAPAGSLLLLAGNAMERLLGQSGISTVAAELAVVPLSEIVHGRSATWSAMAVIAPLVAARALKSPGKGIGN